ncbi:MAG: DNA repair protein RecN [Bacteroidetes bacterium]|nr:DNA repair protein RecN [Bacteroidota bacterium]
MLRSLYIRDFALIDELDVAFSGGLNTITGETGAGKSIVIGAFKLLLGDRASTDVVRHGAKKAIVEGQFDVGEGMASLRAVLEDAGISWQPNLIIRREVSSSGSRAFVNDTPATVGLLSGIASELIDLHGQHDHQSLLRVDQHIKHLDAYAGVSALRVAYQGQRASLLEAISARDQLVDRLARAEKERELFQFQFQELSEAELVEGEDEALAAEARRFDQGEKIISTAQNLIALLYEGEDSIYDQLVRVTEELRDLARLDVAVGDATDEILAAGVSVKELASALSGTVDSLDFSVERMASVRNRVTLLERLKRKYGMDVPALIAERDRLSSALQTLQSGDSQVREMEEIIRQKTAAVLEQAEELSSRRHEAAERLSRQIEETLDALGMPGCRFEVQFAKEYRQDGLLTDGTGSVIAARADGIDVVEFFVGTNVGTPIRPLVKTASGGEISRIMLALKASLAEQERLPILVFDEIDVGISGEIARRVGLEMKRMGAHHQLLVITHLPQIAALGGAQYDVRKEMLGDRVVTEMRPLAGEERVEVLAAMLSGGLISEASRQNARELLAD